jgi:hypothetical protein
MWFCQCTLKMNSREKVHCNSYKCFTLMFQQNVIMRWPLKFSHTLKDFWDLTEPKVWWNTLHAPQLADANSCQSISRDTCS